MIMPYKYNLFYSESNFDTQEEGANLEIEGDEISREPPATKSLDENKVLKNIISTNKDIEQQFQQESCQENESASQDSVLIVGEVDITMADTQSTQGKTLEVTYIIFMNFQI